MKKYIYYQIITFLFVFNSAYCQDVIVQLNTSICNQQFIDLSYVNGQYIFSSSDDGTIHNVHEEDLLSIKFFNGKQGEIERLTFVFDTIFCHIDSISDEKLYYKKDNGILNSVEKKTVYCASFDGQMLDAAFNKYKNTFIEYYRSNYRPYKRIFKTDNTILEFNRITSIDFEKLNCVVTANNTVLNTFMNKNKIRQISFLSPEMGILENVNTLYICTTERSFVKLESITNIQDDSFSIALRNNGFESTLPQNKLGTKALFFYNFNEMENSALVSETSYNKIVKDELASYVKFDLSIGYGYLIGSEPDNITGSQREYLDELRSGICYDVNMHIKTTEGFAIGFKYNQFNTSNSVTDITYDKIKIYFVGAGMFSYTEIDDNEGHFYIGVLAGSLKQVNNGCFQGTKFTAEGSTFGLYSQLGLDVMLSKNIALGIGGGFLWGKMDEFELNNRMIDISDEPDNLSRLDGVIGLKIYF